MGRTDQGGRGRVLYALLSSGQRLRGEISRGFAAGKLCNVLFQMMP
jgi:hypothetical protein